MNDLLRRKPALYVSATIVVFLCVMLRWTLDPYLEAHPTLTVLLPAVVFAGYLGGLSLALFATLLSVIGGISIMRVTQGGSFQAHSVVPQMVSLAVVGVTISLICHQFHIARRRAEEASARRASQGLTEKLLAQQEAESQLRHLADTMPHLVWIARPDGYHEFYNKRWYDYVGKSFEQTKGAGWATVLHPDDVERSESRWKQAIETGEPYEIEYRFRSHDGDYRWFLGRALPLRDEMGTIVKWFGTCTDIHHTKLDEIRDRFLLELEAVIRTHVDPHDITQAAARLLGEHIGANRCAYADVEEDQDTFNLTGDYNDGVPSIIGRYRFADFGEECLRLMREGKPCVVEDSEIHPSAQAVIESYRKAEIRAAISVPVLRADKLVAAMAVHQATPRKWTAAEVELVQQVASRCWESIERARVERELRENEQRLRLAQHVGRVGSFEWSIRDDVVVWTPELEALYGLPPGSLQGGFDAWRKFVMPEDVQKIEEAVKEAIAARIPELSYEFRALLPNNRVRWLHGQSRFYYDPDGKPISMIGVNIDIDEQKRNEQAARAVEERFRRAILDAPIPIIMHAEDGEILEISGAFTKLTGYSKGDFATFADWLRAAYGEEAESARNMMSDWSHERIGVAEQDFTMRTRAGEQRIWRFTAASPGWLPDGRRYLVAMAIDVTEQRRTAREREAVLESERAARIEQERIGRMKDEFLATLSHELRTPLNAILGWAQILSRDTPSRKPADLQKAIETIYRNARVQSQLIDDLLDMNRIISGKISLKVEKVDASEVVSSAVESVRPAADAKDIQIISVLDTTAGPINGDPGRLQQIFWNLLTNAIKFTPKSGRIEVMLRAYESRVELSICDNGQGISPDFLPYVFDRFRQADGSISRRHGGLGLGLAIVKQLVELHGGTIRAESEGENRGSRFIVSLPQLALTRIRSGSRKGDGSSEVVIISPDCQSLEGLRVLVVDDEPDARSLIKRFLEECNAVVITADSAKQGLSALQETKPDIIISDIGMPDVDGLEFIRQVRALEQKNGGRTPAVALTAFARQEDRHRALHAGYQVHICKPVEASELVATVASLAHVT